MIINNVQVVRYQRPLNQPFRIATGSHPTLDNYMIKIELANGINGYGEAAVADHITAESMSNTHRNLKKAARFLKGKHVEDVLSYYAYFRKEFKSNKSALAGVEMALLDAVTRHKKVPFWTLFGEKIVKVRSDITIVIASQEETCQSATRFYRQGFRVFKVKVGANYDLDVKRVIDVHKITRNSDIILDANQGFNARETIRFLKELKKRRIYPKLIEQPVHRRDWDGLKRVTRAKLAPVCADESCRSLNEAIKIIKDKAADVINIKFMKTGILEARAIAVHARAAGVDLMIGGMMESALAMTASAHMAAALGDVKFIDLDTPFFIRGCDKGHRYLNAKGVYDLRPVKYGIGIVPRL